MGIIDKFLNKKRNRSNHWINAPYHTPQPSFQYYPLNENQADFRQLSMDEQYSNNYLNETQFNFSDNYLNETPIKSDWQYQNNSYAQPRDPVTQPFYGNPLAVDSNYYNSSFNGQSQNALYPNGGQYANTFQPYQQGWSGQGYYPNGQVQQGIQPNPFQVNPYFQQPLQPNAMMNNQNSGFSNVLNQFKSQNGSVDINKMMNTAGQMVNAVSQVSGIIKGLSGIFKT
ncbi:MAG: hypothetical protein K0R71_478 [Bacillales bacterium]|jgi:hypothetical protein|nr:hypothetical protein [Bacillales bacterium]